jgi:hypothetical protein
MRISEMKRAGLFPTIADKPWRGSGVGRSAVSFSFHFVSMRVKYFSEIASVGNSRIT